MSKMRTYFAAGPYRVTARSFRARNRTFMLRNVERTQLRRPVLVFALAFAACAYGFTFSFASLIYDYELPWLLVPPVLAMLAAAQIGVLTLRSRALGEDGVVIGRHTRLRRIRVAIDEALEDRAELAAGRAGVGHGVDDEVDHDD